MNQVPPSISELTLAATPNAVSWARRHSVDALQRWRLPVEAIEVARLLTSEVTTNAIRHARPTTPANIDSAKSADPGTIVLRLWPTERGVVISVTDCDPQPPTPRTSDNGATGGRGLLLTEAMANCWGYYPTQLHPGKIVWAEVPTHPKPAISESGVGGPEITTLVMGQVLTALRDL